MPRKPAEDKHRQSAYYKAFRKHVLELIGMGYGRLAAADYRQSEEPVITGDLVRAIRLVAEDVSSPTWAAFFAIHDDPPVNDNRRRGKHRLRVDIEFERTQRGPRPRFQFEAKRLYSSSCTSKYLGADGLGCFIEGRYSVNQDEAGMLGYVQAHVEVVWAERIKDSLSSHGQEYMLRKDGGWERSAYTSLLTHTYRTRHNRRSRLKPIWISHVFLRFS